MFGEIGTGYGNAGQIVLCWILQKGVSDQHDVDQAAEYHCDFEIMDFILSSIGMARVDALMVTGHRIVDRSLVPWAPNFDRGRVRTSSH